MDEVHRPARGRHGPGDQRRPLFLRADPSGRRRRAWPRPAGARACRSRPRAPSAAWPRTPPCPPNLALQAETRRAADAVPAAGLGRRAAAEAVRRPCSRKIPMTCPSLSFDRSMPQSFLWAGRWLHLTETSEVIVTRAQPRVTKASWMLARLRSPQQWNLGRRTGAYCGCGLTWVLRNGAWKVDGCQTLTERRLASS
jgi:hypothetical protein